MPQPQRPLRRGTRMRTYPQSIAKATLTAECMRLRRLGHQYSEIAEMVGVEGAHPENKVRELVLEGMRELKRPAGEDVLCEELDQLDRLFNKAFDLSNRAKSETARVAAINAAVNVQKRRAELLGLDAPKKVDVRDERQHDIPATTIDAVVAQLAAEAGGGGG